MTPPLSVVMPVRNAMPYLDSAVASILGQSFADFEFVIRDDASDDGSTEALRDWAERDGRIRLIEGGEALGPAGSSAFVVRHARAPLVARMDADDVSLPNRLARQMEAMAAAPEAALVASLWEGIDRKGRVVRAADRARLERASPFAPFVHGSILFRRDLFDRIGGYRAECDYWEDIDLFLRFAAAAPVLVLTEPLYRHRFSETSTRLASGADRVEAAFGRLCGCLHDYCRTGGYDPAGAAPATPPPFVFVLAGSPLLWAGERPLVLRRMLRRAELRPDAATARALLWAAWADASPRTLRLALRARLALRNLAAGRPAKPWVEWRLR
jgi:hypothetical protein